jgi:predicted aspartyl protease
MPRIFGSALLLAGILACAGAQAKEIRQDQGPDSAVTLPMHWFGKKPVIEAKINGKGPYQFFFDTGAQGTVLGLDLVEELRLKVVGKGEVTSPGGKGIPSKQVRFGLEVGGLSVKDVSAFAFDRARLYRDPAAPKGVLSPRVFSGYLVIFDFPHERFLIREGELPAADDVTIFACDRKQRIPALPINVAGRKVLAHVDTGAPGGLTLPLSMASQLPLAGKPTVIGRGKRVDREVVVYGAKLQGQIKLGRYVLENPSVRFVEGSSSDGNIGSDILRRFALTFDVKNFRIGLDEPEKKSPSSG